MVTERTVEDKHAADISNPFVLLVLLSASLIGNSLLIVAKAVPSRQRSSTFNVYVMSMAAFGLLECSLTMSLATGFSIEKTWVFGEFLMGFNCCFTQLQNIGVLLTVVAMSVDRYCVICNLFHRRKNNIHHASYIALYTWIHAFAISLPLLFYREAGLQVKAFAERNLCALAEGATEAYTFAVIISSILIPSIVSLFCFVAIFSKHGNRNLANKLCYLNYRIQDSDVGAQSRHVIYVFVLFIGFMIFKLPYMVNDFTTQLAHQWKSVDLNHTQYQLQTGLVWMMFSFSAVYPVITFAWFNECRCGIYSYICHLGRPKLVANSKPTQDAQLSWNTGIELPLELKQCGTKVQTVSYQAQNTELHNVFSQKAFQVPVLYATYDGLHLMESSTVGSDIKEAVSVEYRDVEEKDMKSEPKKSTTYADDGTFHEHNASEFPRKKTDMLGHNCNFDIEDNLNLSSSSEDTTKLGPSSRARALRIPDLHVPVDAQESPSVSLSPCQKLAWIKLPDPWCASYSARP